MGKKWDNPKAAANGRLGGRPKKESTIIAQEFRTALAKRIAAKADKYYDAIEDLALGHFVEITTADGTVKVYKKSPDPKSLQIVTDRGFGRAQQSIDLTSDGKAISAIVSTLEHERE